ncbi:putative cytochrome-b5 reductase [Rosa chinensis]|uniref:Putative cytochrome-b5 reductase n=1 Tax=Rosa chinensis TaxID=74649 RepID=A0A2P6SLG3_ROSCH|nr:putative cytochrome-b5 reductase [Rosa chinensis]
MISVLYWSNFKYTYLFYYYTPQFFVILFIPISTFQLLLSPTFSSDLVIEMYPQGRMSHHFSEMCVGDHLAVKGPKDRFKYEPGQVRTVRMLGRASRITLMFQVARAILENPLLIYVNCDL